MRPLIAFWLSFLAASPAIFAQSAAWTPVEGLSLGERVEVRLFSGGGRIRGTVEQVTSETLVVRRERGVATFDRVDVKRVRIDPGRKSKFGQVFAPSVAGAVALSTETPRWNRGTDVAYMVGSGYLLGWGLDGMVNEYRRKTIYEARRP